MIQENFIKLYEYSFRENWGLPCYTDYRENESYIYGEVAQEIAKLYLLSKYRSLRRDDKIAVIGKNNAHWYITHMATIVYGGIVMPILQDFNPNDVHHIVNHSGSIFLFASGSTWGYLEEERLTGSCGVFSLNNFHYSYQRDGGTVQRFLKHLDNEMHKIYPREFRQEDVVYTGLPSDKVMLLDYISDTTGFDKGVILIGNNLAGNVTFGIYTGLLKKEDKVLSFLPLAHTYGCAFNFLVATAASTHIILLGKVPSPKTLMKASEKVKPNLMITVPLVVEKMHRNVIQPIINEKSMKWALNISLLNGQTYGQIRRKLVDVLGGRLKEVIIGGVAMNLEVEEFFYRIKFPFNVDYGMTGCGLLISYASWNEFVPIPPGRVLGIMEARIYKEDPSSRLGEIQIRGENVMVGYYGNPEAAKEVLVKNGWLHIDDLGTLDENNNLYIRERSRTMILSSSEQNIFPEGIEAHLDNMPSVPEDLVIERNKKLVALVYADYEALDSLGLNNLENIKTIVDESLKSLNNSVVACEKIDQIQLYPTEFERIPRRSIKRYLYNSIAED